MRLGRAIERIQLAVSLTYLYIFDAFTGLYATYVKRVGPAMALIDTTTFHEHRCGGR